MRRLIILYFSLLVLFVIETLLFLVFHWDVYGAFGSSEWLGVLQNSLPHDLTVAGYIVALPLLLKLVHIWLPGGWYRTSAIWITGILIGVALLLWGIDLPLFGYWGFRLDATPMIYLLDNPAEALGSAPWWMYLIGFSLWGLALWGVVKGLRRLWPAQVRNYSHLWREQRANTPEPIKRRVLRTVAGLLLAGVCFVAIRGGVSESTMNTGRAYFSSEMTLNQAAVNPVFSFLYSLSKQKRYDQMYRFMSREECDDALASLTQETCLGDRGGLAVDSTGHLQLLNVDRPNLLIIILEGFSGKALTALNPDADPRVMPCLSKLYEEGIGWTRFYANSWRTDRGVASILASYPAQPTTTVMKDQSKCNHLQYLPLRLKEEGYQLQFVYGGDANFTNMLGFLRAGGIDNVVSMEDFSHAQRQQQWGAPDAVVYDYLYQQMQTEVGAKQPYCKVMLTLSSHEPFDVPNFKRLEHPFANSYAYADSCLGQFIGQIKASPEIWNNLLVVILPDHCSNYPDMEMQEAQRYHIPMVWTGGALRTDTLSDGLPASPRLINRLGGQVDLSATLLGQLGIHHEDFNFSKDLLSTSTSSYAFFDFPDGFGLIADTPDSTRIATHIYIQDNQQDGVALKGSYDPEGKLQRWGKAYLQHLFDDLSER